MVKKTESCCSERTYSEHKMFNECSQGGKTVDPSALTQALMSKDISEVEAPGKSRNSGLETAI